MAEVVEQQRGGQRSIFAGTRDGFVTRLDREDRSIKEDAITDGQRTVAYTATVKTPYLSYGSSLVEKTLVVASQNLEPQGNYTTTFSSQNEASWSLTCEWNNLSQLPLSSSITVSFE